MKMTRCAVIVLIVSTVVQAQDYGYPAYFTGLTRQRVTVTPDSVNRIILALAIKNIRAVGFCGDLNLDGSCDMFDFAIFQDNYGKPFDSTWQEGDLDRDGDIDIFDWSLLQTNKGRVCPVRFYAMTLPEAGEVSHINWKEGTFYYHAPHNIEPDQPLVAVDTMRIQYTSRGMDLWAWQYLSIIIKVEEGK